MLKFSGTSFIAVATSDQRKKPSPVPMMNALWLCLDPCQCIAHSWRERANVLVERMHAECSILVDKIHDGAVLHPLDRRRASGVLVPQHRGKLLAEALMGL